jgi:hypothetical protein
VAATMRLCFAVLCLIAALALAGLWARDRTRTTYAPAGSQKLFETTSALGDSLVLFTGEEARAQMIGSSGGRIYFVFTNVACGSDRAWTALHASGDFDQLISLTDSNRLNIYPPPPPATATSSPVPGFLGFAAVTSQAGAIADIPSSRVFCVVVPHWFVILIPLGCATWLLFVRDARRRRRHKRGLCEECGYDLRASPERCPECGVAVPKARGEMVKSA